MVLEAPQTCIRLHSHPGNGSGGNLAGLKEEDLLHSLWGGQAAYLWKTLVWAQTRSDQGQEQMCPASPPQCLVLFKWLEKLKTGGEWVPWGLLSRSEHLHEPMGSQAWALTQRAAAHSTVGSRAGGSAFTCPPCYRWDSESSAWHFIPLC